ncbi:cilia- and flagella-associated protein 100-like [Acanthochromis polyacanthus]|uniref:cilia- and flagella-associated protein 100-like n=1 Tax=Acanthochromis polyacanthus TaxID=80966 RepID=UPI002234DB7C|nr:cilia- and flagella-associated protein 100-like [Acanthochromis polyacanthus]XP_051810144.1 cilia- and flagella-associated protein 100-like [Acanthochromis polyacanthus]
MSEVPEKYRHHSKKEKETSSGVLAVSETDNSAKLPKAGIRKKRTQLNPFKVPDSNSIFLLSVNERGDQKEERRKFLALPIDEKTTHAVRMMAKLKNELVGEVEEEEEEEGNEQMKDLKQIRSKTVLPKQTPGRHELKIKREKIAKDNKYDLISMERQKAVLELSLMTKRSEILRMDKAIAKEERQLKQLEKTIERDNLNFEAFLRENEKKSVEARTLFEQEAKLKQERNTEIKKLTAETGTIKSEIAKFEEILIDYKRYKELLFKLSPPEWQEAQKTKKTEVLSGKDAQHNQNLEPEEMADKNSKLNPSLELQVSSPGRELPSTRETGPSSAYSNTLVTNSNLDSDCLEYEDEPELYFTDPQQLLDLMTELTEQNLSLIQNSARVEEKLEELKQFMETTRREIEKDEEQIALQITDMNQRIDKEKARGAKLKQKVQLHVSLNTEDQDMMMDALGEKVAEVHRSCVDERMTNLSTLEKLVNIEHHMSLLLQGLESIPEEKLELMKKIKDSEKRTRQREEKLREQQEKQKERMRRYLERSLADSKKITGRKLMPRCMPVAQKVKVSNEDNVPAEDELHEYLFGPEDTE